MKFLLTILLLPFLASAQHYAAFIPDAVPKQQIANLRSLGMRYAKDVININSAKRTTLADSNFCTILNLNAAKVETDTTSYKVKLRNALINLKRRPTTIIIENAPDLYNVSAKAYLNMLRAAVTVSKEVGVNVSNGGCSSAANMYLVYKNLSPADQQKFRTTYQFFSNDAVKKQAAFADSVYRFSPCKYNNFNWVQDAEDVSALIAFQDYLKPFGKTIICTHLATKSGKINALINMLKALHTFYVVIYSGELNSLHDSRGNLTKLGEEVKKYVKQ